MAQEELTIQDNQYVKNGLKILEKIFGTLPEVEMAFGDEYVVTYLFDSHPIIGDLILTDHENYDLAYQLGENGKLGFAELIS
ncbi:MAG: hypothetical protein OEY49_18850 [Candidatus Heimdallarchaeota archaeon]|nr:hypothetical protein [Candidatus Heimdallarchaeota archaeon]